MGGVCVCAVHFLVSLNLQQYLLVYRTHSRHTVNQSTHNTPWKIKLDSQVEWWKRPKDNKKMFCPSLALSLLFLITKQKGQRRENESFSNRLPSVVMLSTVSVARACRVVYLFIYCVSPSLSLSLSSSVFCYSQRNSLIIFRWRWVVIGQTIMFRSLLAILAREPSPWHTHTFIQSIDSQISCTVKWTHTAQKIFAGNDGLWYSFYDYYYYYPPQHVSMNRSYFLFCFLSPFSTCIRRKLKLNSLLFLFLSMDTGGVSARKYLNTRLLQTYINTDYH